MLLSAIFFKQRWMMPNFHLFNTRPNCKNECFWQINSLRFFLSAPYQQTNSSKLQYPLNDFPVCLSNFSVLLEELILFAFLASSWRPILIKLTTASRAFRLQSRCQSIPGLFSSFNTSIFYLYSAPSYFKSPPLSITTSSRLKFVIFKIQKKKMV